MIKLKPLIEQIEVGQTPAAIAKQIINATVGSLSSGNITKYLDALTMGVFGVGTNEKELFEALEKLNPDNISQVGAVMENLLGKHDRMQFDIGDAGIGNGFDRLLRSELTKSEYNKASMILKKNGLKPKVLRPSRSGMGETHHYIWWIPNPAYKSVTAKRDSNPLDEPKF